MENNTFWVLEENFFTILGPYQSFEQALEIASKNFGDGEFSILKEVYK